MINEEFWTKLLWVIVLLVCLQVFNTIIVLYAPFFRSGENMRVIATYSHWIGQLVFGIVIYLMIRKDRNAASIGLLAFAIPLFGALFYLMIAGTKLNAR